MVDAGNVTMGNVIVMRKTPGLAILSAWAAADEVLRHPARHGLPVDVARVIFLQHSTALCRPVKAVSANPDCPAVSLTGFIPMGGTGHMFRRAHFVERLGIISLIAEAVGIACSEPCQRAGPACCETRTAVIAQNQPHNASTPDPCGKQPQCIQWATVPHWTLMFHRTGWDRFVRYQLWPRLHKLSTGLSSWKLPQAC